MSPLLIPILGICCGLLAIFAGAIFRPWMKLKERQMELDAQNIAAAVETATSNKWSGKYDLEENFEPSTVVVNVIRSRITNFF